MNCKNHSLMIKKVKKSVKNGGLSTDFDVELTNLFDQHNLLNFFLKSVGVISVGRLKNLSRLPT